MDIAGERTFAKTDKGQAELERPVYRLNPKARQLLILLDGQRRYSELRRMIPELELQAYLRLLEGEGFAVSVQGTAPSHTSAAAPVAPVAPVAQPLQNGSGSHESVVEVRARMIRALLDTIGPDGADLAARLERSESVAELRQWLPAALSIIEATGGETAAKSFLQRAGRI